MFTFILCLIGDLTQVIMYKGKLVKMFTWSPLIVLLTFFLSCSRNPCPQLNYDELNLDTTSLLKDQIFTSDSNSTLFKSRSYTLNKKESSPSPSTADECANGLYLTYDSEEFDFGFNMYYVIDQDRNVEMCINGFHFETIEYQNLKSLNGIDTPFTFHPSHLK